MRTITVFNTLTNVPRSFTSSATTYGEIKQEVTGGEDLKAVLRDTKVTLESDEAILPEGDFTIFLFPQKVKSGIELEEAEELSEVELALEIADEQLNAIAALDAKLDRVIAALAGMGAALVVESAAVRRMTEAEQLAERLVAEARAMRF